VKSNLHIYYISLKREKKETVLKWHLNFQGHLTDKEKKDLDSIFMNNPGNGGYYCIKEWTLYIKKIRQF
jgi:hypothetical protein